MGRQADESHQFGIGETKWTSEEMKKFNRTFDKLVHKAHHMVPKFIQFQLVPLGVIMNNGHPNNIYTITTHSSDI